jgi:hypothetical protein
MNAFIVHVHPNAISDVIPGTPHGCRRRRSCNAELNMETTPTAVWLGSSAGVGTDGPQPRCGCGCLGGQREPGLTVPPLILGFGGGGISVLAFSDGRELVRPAVVFAPAKRGLRNFTWKKQTPDSCQKVNCALHSEWHSILGKAIPLARGLEYLFPMVV